MHIRVLAPAAASALLILHCATLLGVSMVPLSVNELTDRADVIVHGKVQSKTCLLDSAGRIYTSVQLEVLDVWKGSVSGQPFTISLAGGTLGDKRVVVSGQADYLPGEEVVAFLRLNQRAEGVTIGLSQGKFEVRVDARTGEKLVRNIFLGHEPATTAKTTPENASAPPNRLVLEDLKRAVQGRKR